MDIEKQALIEQIDLLRTENAKLKSLLESYTNSRKSYYEKNKSIVNEKAKERLKKISSENPDIIKEYRRNAYLKTKLKKLNEQSSSN